MAIITITQDYLESLQDDCNAYGTSKIRKQNNGNNKSFNKKAQTIARNYSRKQKNQNKRFF